MKPQDLRIGNYVRIKGCDKIHRISAIDALNGMIGIDAYKTDTNGVKQPIGYSIDDIEPVLISEMDGFLPYIKYLEWYDREDVDIYHYKGTPLTGLHELQNIHYALTGNEIEIEI